MNDISIVVGVCALLFTVFSFWWMHWRRGKLYVYAPRSFCFVVNQERVLINVPLVFYNNGAAPIVVENLKLYFDSLKDDEPLKFQAVHEKLYSEKEERVYATQFVVNGRESKFLVCEFQRKPSRITIDKPERIDLRLSAKLGHKKKWIDLKYFSLNIKAEMIANIGRMIPLDNDD